MKQLIYLTYLLLLFSMTSCDVWYRSTQTYINNVPYSPMFQGKGELKLSGNIGLNHVEGQSAISISNRLGLKTSIYSGNDGRNYMDLGIGGYKELKESNYIEVFAGYGEGSMRNDIFKTSYSIIAQYYIDYYTVDANFKRYYIQPSYYYKGNHNQLIGFGMRVSHVHYPTYKYERIHESNTEPNFIDKVDLSNFSGAYLEPNISVRMPLSKVVSFNLQTGLSVGLFNDNFRPGFNHPVNQIYFLNTGIQIDI